jgi:hypothetical protein
LGGRCGPVLLLVLWLGVEAAPGAAPSGLGGRAAWFARRALGRRAGAARGAERDHDRQPAPALGQAVAVTVVGGPARPGHPPAAGTQVVRVDGHPVRPGRDGHGERSARPAGPGVGDGVGGQLGGGHPEAGRGPSRDALDPDSARVLGALRARGGAGTLTIAAETGVDLDTVLRCLGRLAGYGFIERCDRGWRLRRP